jgi:glucose-1-phosphate cytidylyltransferase
LETGPVEVKRLLGYEEYGEFDGRGAAAMKTVLLAGGRGSRLSEETELKPKPMVEIGGEPILCHIMNVYAAAGFEEFVVALGYKGNHIKSFFQEYFSATHDLTVDLATGKTTVLGGNPRSWRVHLVDTGLDTQTGGRIKRLTRWLNDETFMLTYGDGLADVDIRRLVEFHRGHGKLATVTAVRPPARFGALVLEGDSVLHFSEKPQTGEGWINGGFFVLEPGVLDYIDGDRSIWERDPLERLAREGQLRAYLHDGFWQPMDTLREKQYLEELWNAGKAPWKIW